MSALEPMTKPASAAVSHSPAIAAAPPPSSPPPALAPGANGASSPLAPSAATDATHPASWEAMLNMSLFDDDVNTLSPEQRAKRQALDKLRGDYLAAQASDGILDGRRGGSCASGRTSSGRIE